MTWAELKEAVALTEQRHGVNLDGGTVAAPDETFNYWTIVTDIGTPESLLYLLKEGS